MRCALRALAKKSSLLATTTTPALVHARGLLLERQPRSPLLMPPLPVKRPGRPRKGSDRSAGGLSDRVREAIDLMVWQAMKRPEAAAQAGIADNTLRQAFGKPAVMAYYNRAVEVLRAGERARNIHTAVEVRDDPSLRGTAAGGKARLDAAKWLHGEDGAGGVTVNVGVGLQVTPGYVVAPSPRRAMIGHQVPGADKPLELQANVPGAGRGTTSIEPVEPPPAPSRRRSKATPGG